MESLLTLFPATLDADVNVRRSAELELRKLEGQPGMLAASFQLITAEGVDLSVRQAASIYVKNRIATGWDAPPSRTDSGRTRVPDEDRAPVRSALLTTIASVPEPLRVHVASAINGIARCDFPDAWPSLLQEINMLLAQPKEEQVYAGVRALLEVVRAFRFSDPDTKLESIVAQTFPQLLQTTRALLDSPHTSLPQVGEIVYYALKTYKTSMVVTLSEHQRSAESIVPWGTVMLRVVQKPLEQDPAAAQDPDAHAKTPWWGAKKWAFFSLNKLFSRYGNPSQLAPSLKSYKPFAENFIAQFAPEILRAYLHVVERVLGEGVWVSKPVTRSLLLFFAECVKAKAMWSELRPHIRQLIEAYVYPLLCFSDADAELWELDPIDFVRSRADPIEDDGQPGSAARQLLGIAVAKRTKTAFEPTLHFITSVLNAYPGSCTPRQKDGALAMCITIAVTMVNSEQVQDMLEAFFVQHVLPELKSEHAFLRLRACEMVQTFDHAGMKWHTGEGLEGAFRGVMDCIMDAELPVRVAAAQAIGELIAHDEVHNAMAPNAGRLMQELLKLSDETDMDVLMATQEKVVNNFAEELLPFSVQLVEQMVASYSRLVRETVANQQRDADGVTAFNLDQSEEDKYFAALGCLSTMYQMITAAESRPEILAQLEQALLPAIVLTLETESIDLYDDCFQLTDVLTYYQKKISPGMWHVFELMYKSFKSSGVDYLSEMIGTFDNCASYGTEVLRQNAQYREMLIDIFHTAIASEELVVSDQIAACQLAEVILLLLKGYVDEAVPSILGAVLGNVRRKTGVSANLRKWSVAVAFDALFYNPALTLQVLQANGTTSEVFTEALHMLPRFKRIHDCKLVAVAILSIFSLPPDAVPDAVRAGYPSLMRALVVQLKALPAAVKKRKEHERALEEEDEDEFDEQGGAEEFDDDADVQDDDNEYLELLAQEAARLRAKVAATDAGEEAQEDDGEEDFDEDDELDDDVVYESPLENVPVFEPFRMVMHKLQSEQPELLQGLTESLSPELQQQLKEAYDLPDSEETGMRMS